VKTTLIAANVLVHLVLPTLLLLWMALARHHNRARFLAVAVLTATYLLCIGRAGVAWPWLGMWWPWLWYASFPVACASWLARHWRHAPWWPERKILPITGLVLTSLLALLLLGAIPRVLRTRTFDGVALELQPPLSGGLIVVANGGSGEFLNAHTVVPAQQYALDILGLDGTTRADGIYPDELAAYAIWSRSVVAPCAGNVVAMENAVPDVMPGLPNAKSADAAGNHVVIRCGAYLVVLAHLQRGSVPVELGANVNVGDLLGLVGNSGNTSEPHLHIHAVAGDAEDRDHYLWLSAGVPITFGGRFLVRGDTAEW
jgi:hypothetical protein